ncbi:hypothetical protein AMTRI_Chr02g256390 [Amborella trichopoda]
MPNELPPHECQMNFPHVNTLRGPTPATCVPNQLPPPDSHKNSPPVKTLLPNELPPRECQLSLDCQLKKSQRAIRRQDNIQPNHIVGFFYSIHSSHIASMWDIYVS